LLLFKRLYDNIIIIVNIKRRRIIMLEKKSKAWFLIGAVVFTLVFISLYYVFILHFTSQPEFENISGFILLSAIVSVVIGAGGYYGAKYYAIGALIVNLLGLIYMIFVAYQDSQMMLHSLASLISYFVVLLPGLLIGAILELAIRKAKKVK
jgi:hypothetical protein